MGTHFTIVDLFAGPGGLAEGFSKVARDGRSPFTLALSVEKEVAAHSTLLLRSFLRQFGDRLPPIYYDFLNSGAPDPDWESRHPKEWKAAQAEALNLELGASHANQEIDRRLDTIRERSHGDVILIGGPP